MFTAEELAAHADTTVQRIEWMTELGILTPSDEGYRRSDIQLVAWPTPWTKRASPWTTSAP